jgi:peptide/nickel transport system permease protein
VLTFIVRRLFWAVMLAAIITLFTFIIFFVIPTDTRSTLSGRGAADPTLAGQFHLRDKPVTTQYVLFLKRLVEHGDLGRSVRSGIPVRQTLSDAVPVTASLVIGGAVTWFLMAFPIGVLTALRARTRLDKALMVLVLVGASAHPIWLGLILSFLLGFKLHVFPVTGYCDFFNPSTPCGGPTQWAYHMLLPWITFACLFAALYARMIRASMIEAMDEDYVRTARAKGAGTFRVLRRHVIRNAMLPVVSMLGMDIGLAFGGALFIEVAFGLPGMGKVLVAALAGGDLPIIMGVVLVISFAVAIANLIVDVLYSWIDPRVRVRGADEGSGELVAPRPGLHLRAQPRVVKESTT